MTGGRLLAVVVAALACLIVGVGGVLAAIPVMDAIVSVNFGEIVEVAVGLPLFLGVIVAAWCVFLWTYNKIEDLLDQRAIEEHKRRKTS